MGDGRHFRLEAGEHEGAIRFLADRVEARALAESATTVETVTRAGRFYDPRYGWFDITRKMLGDMVANFDAGVYGQDVAIDVAHNPSAGAAGYVRRLFLDGSKLRAEIEWTEMGRDAIQNRGFKYLSAEFHENWRDNEEGKVHGPTLLGAALTVRPVIKRLDPIQLSEDQLGDGPTLVSDRISRLLAEDDPMDIKKLLQELRDKLGQFNLAEEIISQLMRVYEGQVQAQEQQLSEDQARSLMEPMVESAKKLAEQLPAGDDGAGRTINLSIEGGGQGLTQEQVTKLLDEREAERERKRQEAQQHLDGLKATFEKKLGESESVQALSEEEAKPYYSAKDLITADMTEAQVTKLAEHQVAQADQLVATKKLSGMGYGGGPGGSVRITAGEQDEIKSLQERMDERMGLSTMSDARRFANTGGALQDDNKALAEKVLAQFDAARGSELYQEHKALAGGDGVVGDTDVPAAWERTVIREALYDLIGTQFIDSDTAEFASSMVLPYSYRDSTAAGRDSTRVYEGSAIPRAGVIQTSETAYPIPQKLAFEVSDELRYLTRAGRINWDAVVENQRNASRIIREDTEQLIFNEILRAADEYTAVSVSGEDLSGDVDGTNNVIPLTNFPVVRPRTTYDLQGNQVGSTSHPITVNYAGSAIDEYDGTGEQTAGDYYTLDYNLGELRIVDETGALQTPAGGTALSVDYHYAANKYAFDTDTSDTEAVHWNSFLYRYGLRKSVIEDDRYHMADFGLMSGNLMTQVEQADKFDANSKRPGTDLAADGNLGRVKDVPNFKTRAPGLWMGDQRAVIGERSITRLRMMKPWQMGELENQKDANGRNTGKKEAYGDQFLVLHTPTQLKRAYTSIVTYSSSGRVARAE